MIPTADNSKRNYPQRNHSRTVGQKSKIIKIKKTIFILFTITVFSCGQKQSKDKKDNIVQTQINYDGLIDKHIKSSEVTAFLNTLGSEYEYDDTYGRKFYIYENKGVELNFTKTDTLKSIWFKVARLNPNIELPRGIKASDTRKKLEAKLGKADKYFVGLKNLNAYYYYKNLVIGYRSKDSVNMNNGIEKLSVQKLDKNKILGAE